MPNLLSQLQSAQQRLPSLRSSLTDPIGVNRERAAVLARQGFAAYDAWSAIRPALAIGGAIGVAASVTMLIKRRKTPEAVALYALTLALSAGALVASKPLDLLGFGGKPSPTKPSAGGAVAAAPSGSFLDWLDKKRASYTAEDPQWADRTMNRVKALPAVQDVIKQQPLIASVL